MDATTLDVTADGRIGRITLNRPDKLNALSITCLEELVAAARWFDDRPEVTTVVVSGAGRAFSAGADLASFTEPSDRGARYGAEIGLAMTEAIESMRACTIAGISGHCVGGGFVLALACDLRIAAPDARFSIPEVDLGIPLTWGAIPRMVRELGPTTTRDLVMSCRPFSGEEAMAMRFVSRLDADPVTAAEALAAELAAKAPLTIRATLDAVDAAAEAMAPTGYCWSDADALVVAQHDPESRAAAAAYLERVRRR